MNIDDALIEKPHCFSIITEGKGERHFYLFPVTLGKLHLLKRHMENLHVNMKNMELDPYLEVMRVARKHKEEICRVVTYHTLKKKRDIFDYDLVEERVAFFNQHLTTEEAASLLLMVMTKDDIDLFRKYLGISNELERMRQFAEAKKKVQKTQNDFTFGCKSTYGALIDTACERYGWSYDYVVWGISLINLRLMLDDRLQSIYLSDEEKKKIPSRLLNSSDTINADDKANQEKILSMDWR